MASDKKEKEVGLECLDDDTLAAIVSNDDGNGELSYEAKVAFAELERRSKVHRGEF